MRKVTAATIAIAIACAAAAAYARALDVGFFSDDLTWLARMDATRAHPSYLLAIFGRDFTPLFHSSLLVDFLVAGAEPWMFHASSIAVHCGCAALLFELLRRLLAASPLAAAAHAPLAAAIAATWALNVRLSEAVIWPAARCHSLATLLVLAALVVLAGRSRARVAGAVLLLLLGLLAKETAVAGVLLAPLFLATDPDAGEPHARMRARLFASLGALMAAFVLFNHYAKPALGLSTASAGELVLKIPFVLLRPAGLGDAYPFTWPAFALVMGVTLALAWLLRRTTARLGFAWLLLFVLIVVPLEKVSSRYLYALAIGHALVLCGLVELAAARLVTASARRAAAALAIGVAALVLIANALLIQREIDDYASLARRYDACLEALAPAARDLAPGVTVTVWDASPRTAVQSMIDESWERGGIVKLLPDRAQAVGGLVHLADAMNIARSGEDAWAIPGAAGLAAESRQFTFDGARLVRGADGAPPSAPRFDAHLGTFAEMRAAEKARDDAAIRSVKASTTRDR